MTARQAARVVPGPKNAITDVAGIHVGNAEARALLTGVTAVVTETPALGAVSVMGGAPGTRGESVLGYGTADTPVDAVVLSGGSAFGLDAPGGAMDWLMSQGRGFAMGPVRVPIVPGAIIFDLLTGGPKTWDAPPWWELGRAAASSAGPDFALGNAGAGLGAKAGKLKGGLGTASFVFEGITVGAVVVVNALGSVTVPGTRAFWAWPFERGGEFGGVTPPAAPIVDPDFDFGSVLAGMNTTIAVVATDAALDRAAAQRVALMAQDGLARAIRPAHTPLDGDTVFVLATGRVALAQPLFGVAKIGHLAADCLARAIARGVYEAEALGGLPAWRDL